MKKYKFLNINPSNMIVLKFHMLLLYIYHRTQLFKTMFLSGLHSTVGIKVMYIFQALKLIFFGKNHVSSENFIVNTF